MFNFDNAEEDVVLGHAVYCNALVYLFKKSGKLRGGIHAVTISPKFKPHQYQPSAWLDNPLYIDVDSPNLREATQEDFDLFRVCSEGHI